jgi:hypothetical protein
MNLIGRAPARTFLAPLVGVLLFAETSAPQTTSPPAQYPALPSETPAQFLPATERFDYVKRDVMIPMRDGVKLHTVILVPKGARGAPILLTRTPYKATDLTRHAQSAHLGPVLSGYDNATDVIVDGGYIRVVQDVRGKYGSEGDYIMNRPLRGPQNPTPVDHSTDTYDTIDWLVKNVPESNGKVGILGISYDGFLPLMALVDPHPALKVSVPMNPMVDGWMGDDWFHNGAFRQQNMPYIYDQVATRANDAKWWTSYFDDYDLYLQAGSAGELGRSHGLEQVGFWRKILEHPSYDAFWRDQAVDRILAAQPLKASWAGDRGRQRARRPEVRQRHRAPFPPGDPAALPRPVPEGRRAEERRASGRGVRDGYERVAAPRRLAGRMPERLHGAKGASPSRPRPEAELRPAAGRRGRVRRVRLRPRQARALPRATHPARRLRQRDDVVRVAGGRSARGLRPPGRAGLRVRRPERAAEDQRTADGTPGRLHDRHGLRLGS